MIKGHEKYEELDKKHTQLQKRPEGKEANQLQANIQIILTETASGFDMENKCPVHKNIFKVTMAGHSNNMIG